VLTPHPSHHVARHLPRATHRLAERVTVARVTAAAGAAPHHALPDVIAVGCVTTDTEISLYGTVEA